LNLWKCFTVPETRVFQAALRPYWVNIYNCGLLSGIPAM